MVLPLGSRRALSLCVKIEACVKGYSPSLRHLPRHQRCALGTVHDTCFGDSGSDDREQLEAQYGIISLEHKVSEKHKGDMFTKEMPRQQFESLKALLGMRRNS